MEEEEKWGGKGTENARRTHFLPLHSLAATQKFLTKLFPSHILPPSSDTDKRFLRPNEEAKNDMQDGYLVGRNDRLEMRVIWDRHKVANSTKYESIYLFYLTVLRNLATYFTTTTEFILNLITYFGVNNHYPVLAPGCLWRGISHQGNSLSRALKPLPPKKKPKIVGWFQQSNYEEEGGGAINLLSSLSP